MEEEVDTAVREEEELAMDEDTYENNFEGDFNRELLHDISITDLKPLVQQKAV